MKTKLLRVLLFISIVSFVASCTSVKINSATRNIVYPGIPSGKISMSYEVVLNSNFDFSISKIIIGEKEISIYSLQDQETHAFVNVKKNDYKAGSYKLVFKSSKVYKDGENNKVTIEIIQKGKTKVITAIVTDKKPVHKR